MQASDHYQIYQHQIYQGPKHYHRCRLYGIDKVRISTQTLALLHPFFPTTMNPQMRCFLQNRYVKRKKYFWKKDIFQPSNISSKINIYTKGTFSSKRILPHFPLCPQLPHQLIIIRCAGNLPPADDLWWIIFRGIVKKSGYFTVRLTPPPLTVIFVNFFWCVFYHRL